MSSFEIWIINRKKRKEKRRRRRRKGKPKIQKIESPIKNICKIIIDKYDRNNNNQRHITDITSWDFEEDLQSSWMIWHWYWKCLD